MNGILETLQTIDKQSFKPIPFWSINSKLKKEEIIRQIHEMKSYGLGGFVFHARTGLETEYLSEEWFEMVEAALIEAKRLGMIVWIYDENGWPSGFVGGKLLEKESNRATYLTLEILNEYDENAFAVYEYTQQGGARWLKEKETIQGKYYTIYKKSSDAYTDILNPEVTDQFIQETYEKYHQRFAELFGKELVGFFTDEPQYYRYETPISAVTEKEFLQENGYDVREGLLYLFLQDEKGYPFRIQYYNLMNRLYCENFYKRLMDWCESKGCLLTGHTVEETFLTTQMWGSADAATSYLYEHIPAIDNLEKSLTAEISAKLVGSIAAQTGKKIVCTETFGISGYSVTPKQLKLIADKQYVYGVNTMIQHLYNYSLAGQGKTDCPPSFGRMMPWVSGYSTFNAYFEKLGYVIANSHEHAPVAVVVPMESVYLDYLRLDEKQAQDNVDMPFWETLTALRNAGIAYHFVNEKILQKIGSVNGAELVVGERAYSAVVLANCRELKASTCSILKDYTAAAGKLCIAGDTPSFVDGVKTDVGFVGNCTISELPKPVCIQADNTVSYCYRTFNGKNFLMVVNENDKPVTLHTQTPFARIDLINDKGYRAMKEHVIAAGASIFLEENGDYQESFTYGAEECSVVPQYLSSEENNLTIERVTVIKENGESLTGYMFGVFEMLIKRKYEGSLRVQFRFESDCDRQITLTREKQNIYNATFNGAPLGAFTQAEEDVNFEYVQLMAKQGENVYEYQINFTALRKATEILYKPGVPESLINCATYWTGMEQIYIQGNFDVDGYTLTAKSTKQAGDLSEQGYSNFAGMVKYVVDVDTPMSNVYIKPLGNYTQCLLKIQGQTYRVMMEEGVFVSELPQGQIEIECYSTLRNRIGPFHFGAPFDDRVSPRWFTMRDWWESETYNKFYYAPKRVVPFGLEKIVFQQV